MTYPHIICVLRSGGDFGPHDVGVLQSMLKRHMAGHQLWCISDVEVPCRRINMVYDWPGWWAKMCIFSPVITGDLFYLDLDTVILADIRHLLNVRHQSVMLRDWLFPARPNAALMYIRQEDKQAVWDRWMRDPADVIARMKPRRGPIGGDGPFLSEETDFALNARRWQDIFPGDIVSYPLDCRERGRPPEGAKLICFFSKPRPRECTESWVKENWR